MKHTIISFGLLLFSVLVLSQLAKFYRFESTWSSEIWIAAFSIMFLFIGIFLARKLQKDRIIEKQVVVEKEVLIRGGEFSPDLKMLDQLNISKREYEVLQLIVRGMTNQQIADNLYLSEYTVKKHITNLFFKLDVERRTEAVYKARELQLVM